MKILRKLALPPGRSRRRSVDEVEMLRRSPLLDPVWYRQTYSDLRDTPLDVARHYLEHGASEGRDPGPDFSTSRYLEQHPDIDCSEVNPLVHFLMTREGHESATASLGQLVPLGLDEKAYLFTFPDIALAISSLALASATDHYKNFGRREIESGSRQLLPQAQAVKPQEVIGTVLYLISRIASPKHKPWEFLGAVDQAFIDTFVFLLFENVYVNGFSDIHDSLALGALPSGLAHWVEKGRAEIVAGNRSVFTITAQGKTIAADYDDTKHGANLKIFVESINDWGSVLFACSTGEVIDISDKALGPMTVPAQTFVAEGALKDLNQARLTPAYLSMRSDIHVGAATHFECDPKVVAFYLPQFHRVKENDEWWGEGFTEWTNVRKARPNFVGHSQPRVPFGRIYYDLADPAVQRNQAAQAKEYGVAAFCYYAYWFDGRRLLERPLDQMLADKTIDHQFCLCWANENWTRTWDGKADNILVGQTHTPESDRRFIRDMMKYLLDPRYFRIDGKPALLVYRVDLLPDCRQTADIWREEVRKAGLGELHLCAVQFYGVTDPEPWGFDAAVEFPPHGWLVPENAPDVPPALLNANFKGHILDYEKAVNFALRKPSPNYRCYRGAFPGWDNTARRQDTPHIFSNSDPFKFERWMREIIRQTVILSSVEHQIVFVNAWNEWGEGAHLEPDDQNGFLNLMALNSALQTAKHQAWPLGILSRLRQAGNYPGRDEDERALLNLLRGQERAFNLLASELRVVGRNPFV